MNRWVFLMLGLVLSTSSMAAGTPVEASMIVTGTITVSPDGSVQGYTLHESDKLPPLVQQIVQQTVPHWQFVPIMAAGKPATAETGMSLRVVADITDKQHATIRVTGADFGCNAYQAKSLLPNACMPDMTVEPVQRKPPDYPIGAARAGIGGEVFLTLQIDRGGHVSRAAASQVNLYNQTVDAAAFRKVLTDSAVRAAMKWTFKVATVGPEAAKDRWIVRVPVNYTINNTPASSLKYGQWNSYIPGPKNIIPWDDEDRPDGARSNADAIAGSAPFVRDTRFVLKTNLGLDARS